MKIVVATGKGGLDDQVAPTFGRAASFTPIEVDGNKIAKVEVVPNQFAGAPGGAGIQAAQWVANAGAKDVIAGNYGPNAVGVLGQAGIEMLTLSGLTVREAVERYLKGKLAPSGAGAMATPGFGPGMGMGRGMGMGYGMGPRIGYYGWPDGGRGNPYSFCRFFPWLPRGRWRTGMYGAMTPYSYRSYGAFPQRSPYTPYSGAYAQPYYY